MTIYFANINVLRVVTHNKTLLAQPAAAGTVHVVARPKARRYGARIVS
jgi:hypothetical protein